MTSGEANSVRMARFARWLREECGPGAVAHETLARGIVDRLDNEWMPRNAPQGDAGKFENVDIAEGVGWQLAAERLVAGLLEAGIFANCDEHRLVRIEYHTVAPNYIRDKVRRLGGFVTSPPDAKAKPEAKPKPRAAAKGGAKDKASDSAKANPGGEPGPGFSSSPSLSFPSPSSPSCLTAGADWEEEVEESVRKGLEEARVSAIDAAIAAAKARGATSHDALAILAEFEARPGAWDAG
jgi:hypothetical protein